MPGKKYDKMTAAELQAALEECDQERLAVKERALEIRSHLDRKLAEEELAAASKTPRMEALRARAGVAETPITGGVTFRKEKPDGGTK